MLLAVLLLVGARCATMVQEFVFLPEVVQQEASPSAAKEATMALSDVGENIVSEVMQSARLKARKANARAVERLQNSDA